MSRTSFANLKPKRGARAQGVSMRSEGVDPAALLGEAHEGMAIVGQRFAKEEYFIPDLIFSGEILKGRPS